MSNISSSSIMICSTCSCFIIFIYNKSDSSIGRVAEPKKPDTNPPDHDKQVSLKMNAPKSATSLLICSQCYHSYSMFTLFFCTLFHVCPSCTFYPPPQKKTASVNLAKIALTLPSGARCIYLKLLPKLPKM